VHLDPVRLRSAYPCVCRCLRVRARDAIRVTPSRSILSLPALACCA
jgi:hypothetical protein